MRRIVTATCAVALGAASFPAWGQSSPTRALPPAPPRSTAALPPAPPPPPAAPYIVRPRTASGPAPSRTAPPAGSGATAASNVAASEVQITTRDGAVFRGQLIEKLPRRYVTLRLATGEYRRIAWNYITHMTGPGVQSAKVPKVAMHFKADSPSAVLEKYVGAWRPVCFTPCDGKLSLGASYRVGGHGIRPSEPFKLSRSGRKLEIKANVGTSGRSIAGGILGVGGGGVLYVGSLVFLSGLSSSATTTNMQTGAIHPVSDSTRLRLRSVGGTMMLAGAALAITGLVILLDNKTDVTISGQRHGPAAARPAKLLGLFQLARRGVVF